MRLGLDRIAGRRRQFTALAASFFLLLTINGCGVAVKPFPYRGYADAWILSNGCVELVVVPSIGRIMRYAYLGQQNVLWENETVEPSEWQNYGGSKIWIWPQSDWKKMSGKEWPPPNDTAAFRACSVRRTTNGITMTSPQLPGYASRIITEVNLAPTGTRVTLISRLEPCDGHMPYAVPWVVTQVPASDDVVVRQESQLPSTHAGKEPPLVTRKLKDDRIQVLPLSSAGKSYFDAKRVDTRLPDGSCFSQEQLSKSTSGETQIFMEGAAQATPGRSRYTEIEFLPSIRASQADRVITLNWSLARPFKMTNQSR